MKMTLEFSMVIFGVSGENDVRIFPWSFWVSVKKMTLEFSMAILSLSKNDAGNFHGQ